MTDHDKVKEIRTYKKQMKELIREFMKADDIETADKKLNEATDLATKVAILEQEVKENGFIAKLKQKLGLS